MKKITLILDLDGVLITTPPWRADEIDEDGYSKFNMACVANLNALLSQFDFDIWLSSTRRTVKSMKQFSDIFKNRGIQQPILGFVPEYVDCKNRKEEIVRFILEHELSELLIIDDDKSLNELEEHLKQKFVLTELQSGFNDERLTFAIKKIGAIQASQKSNA